MKRMLIRISNDKCVVSSRCVSTYAFSSGYACRISCCRLDRRISCPLYVCVRVLLGDVFCHKIYDILEIHKCILVFHSIRLHLRCHFPLYCHPNPPLFTVFENYPENVSFSNIASEASVVCVNIKQIADNKNVNK